MKRKPQNSKKGIFTKGMSFRVIYQGIMIGLITLAAFILGLATPDETIIQTGIEFSSIEEVKVNIGQAMAFTVLSFSELVHVFNVRNNKKSIFKTGIFQNMKLIFAILLAAILMLVVLFVPALRQIFGIPILPIPNIIEIICLVFAPLVIVEIFKLLKINTAKDE